MSLALLRRSAPRTGAALVPLCKRWLSISGQIEPVDLAYDLYDGPFNPNAENGPLLIVHGLFGMKRHWQSLGKALARSLGRPVAALDLRNFGSSPRTEQLDYPSMAADIVHFCDKHSLRNVSLLGHSMGGKVAMAVALSSDRPADMLSHLIIADISPIKATLSSEFRYYTDGMIKIEEDESAKSRTEAYHILEEYTKDDMICRFLLTNLAPTRDGEPVKFNIPLHTIRDAFPKLGDFPYDLGEAKWEGPTLFIKGSRSNYIKYKNVDTVKKFFPRMQIESLDAGHWVHFERPEEFKCLVESFLKGNTA